MSHEQVMGQTKIMNAVNTYKIKKCSLKAQFVVVSLKASRGHSISSPSALTYHALLAQFDENPFAVTKKKKSA